MNAIARHALAASASLIAAVTYLPAHAAPASADTAAADTITDRGHFPSHSHGTPAASASLARHAGGW